MAQTITFTLDVEDAYRVLGSLRKSGVYSVREAGRKLRAQVALDLPLRCPVTFPTDACGDFTPEDVDPKVALAEHLVEEHDFAGDLADYRARLAVKKWGGQAALNWETVEV